MVQLNATRFRAFGYPGYKSHKIQSAGFEEVQRREGNASPLCPSISALLLALVPRVVFGMTGNNCHGNRGADEKLFYGYASLSIHPTCHFNASFYDISVLLPHLRPKNSDMIII